MAKGGKKRGRRHDAAFKNLYAFALMAWDLMEAVLPRELFEELDFHGTNGDSPAAGGLFLRRQRRAVLGQAKGFDTLERLPCEWFGARLQSRVGDAVWRGCGGPAAAPWSSRPSSNASPTS